MRLTPVVAAATLAAVSLSARAAAPAAAMPGPIGGLVQVVLALGLVLGLIAALAWLVRRLNQAGLSGGRAVRVVGGTLLGGRERVVVVEVSGRWLVLGVTPQHISLLKDMERPDNADTPPSSLADGNFAARLKTAIERLQRTPSDRKA